MRALPIPRPVLKLCLWLLLLGLLSLLVAPESNPATRGSPMSWGVCDLSCC